ncbi:MAG: zinc-dependent metalloprotease [Bacteroidales bacterium]|nr:zinc-dependent metalloprotease [Bacteroidales bacterium]
MKRIQIASMALAVALVLAPSLDSDAKISLFRKKAAKTEAVKDTVKKESRYEKLFKKEKECCRGMITLHLKDGKVWFELPESLLGRQFVMGSTIKSISDNGNGTVGAKDKLIHFTFVKVDSTIQMRSVNSYYIADDPNIEAALASGRSGYVRHSFPIKAVSPDSAAVVFDATPIFLEHDEDMSPFIEISAYAAYDRKESYKKDLSYISGIKAFEDNVSVTSSMSYTYTMSYMGKTIYKDRPLTAELTRSILLLPEEIYHPRMADPRIAVFFTQRQQFSPTTGKTRPVVLANRWRLEPSDTAAWRAGIPVEPVKPIVWYIDSNFPEWWQPYIFEAVEQWNELFLEIGFKNAIVARPFPKDDPSFDPDNIRYSCVRYAPIGIQNATGPSWVDPRSGEIINASVYVYHDIIKLLTRWRFIQTAQADPDVRCAELPREILGDGIRYVIAHEIGHTLGFMHNMSGSSVIPVESLRDPGFTATEGTTTSIMDYARFNYVAQPGDKERGVSLTPPRFGKYDRWLVKWTYTPVLDAENFAQEAAITSEWISDALKQDPDYRYGKQQFSSMLFDPRSQTEDLGDDAVAATKYGVSNLKYIMRNFMDWISEDDDEYETRTDIYNAIINQYLMYVQHVTMNVGGLYKNEIKKGDPMPRFENIPAARQKAALDYLFTLWKDVEWFSEPSVVARLPIFGSPVHAIRESVQSMIMATPFLASYSDGISTQEFSAWQCLDAIYSKVFEPTRKGRRLSADERFFQKYFVHQLMKSANIFIPGTKKNSISSMVPDYVPEGSEQEAFSLGTMTYDPVSGYEWMPRYIFNRGSLTKANIHTFLVRARDLMQSRTGSAAEDDRAHYQLLIDTINYTMKRK